MRVLMFGWEFPPFNSGGLGVACQGLTQALVRKGTRIAFVLPKRLAVDAPDLDLVYASESLKITTVNSLLTPYITSGLYTIERSLITNNLYAHTLLEEVTRYAARAGQIAQDQPNNVIHAHDWLSFPAGVAAHQATGKPLVAHVHATEFDRCGGQGVNQVVYDIEREGMHKAHAIVAVSNLTKRIIVDKYGVSPHKVHVIHNGINLSDYNQSFNTHNILALKQYGLHIVLFAGRITLQKGPDYFLQTAKKVLAYVPNTIFIMAGSGDMERRMVHLSSQLGITDKVTFTGYLRDGDLNKVYRSADLLVMPSVSEPFGITALESLANGTPVLISKQTGVKEVISHALTADFWDTDEMANKIIAVLRYRTLHQVLQQNGTSELQYVTWEKAAERCNTLYNQLRN